MKEKTLRYPGHAELMRIFRESGFFGTEPVQVEGREVRPAGPHLAAALRPVADAGGRGGLHGHAGGGGGTARRAAGALHLRPAGPLRPRHAAPRPWPAPPATPAPWWPGRCWRGRSAPRGIVPPETLGREPALWADLMAGYAARGIRVTETVATDPHDEQDDGSMTIEIRGTNPQITQMDADTRRRIHRFHRLRRLGTEHVLRITHTYGSRITHHGLRITHHAALRR